MTEKHPHSFLFEDEDLLGVTTVELIFTDELTGEPGDPMIVARLVSEEVMLSGYHLTLLESLGITAQDLIEQIKAAGYQVGPRIKLL